MKNAIILHGTAATPDSNWFKWLKSELEKRGFEVWLPQLPGAEKPNVKTYNDFLLHSDFNFNKETILIGHSSGAVSILNLLQALPRNIKIKAAFLVGAFRDDLGWDSLHDLFQQAKLRRKHSRKDHFQEPFDFEKIKSHCSKFVFIHSDNDPHCPLSGAKYLANKLGGELLIKPGQGHFNLQTGPQYKKFPYLIEIIDSNL